MKTVIENIAGLIVAIQNCQEPGFNGNADYPGLHVDRLESLAREHLPSGSGFDRGCSVDIDASRADCVVINTSFHHIDDNGCYCGWTDHVVKVRAHLAFGFTVSVSGRNYRGIKEYIGDTFHHALSQGVK